MADIAPCFGIIAPYYNLALVTILIILFIHLMVVPNKKKVYYTPWKLIFAALMIFVVEEAMTVLGGLGIITFPRIVFAFFEMVIITIFIYACLIQKENIENAKD